MTCPLPLRHPTDLDTAARWGANCGPASLAAALSVDLEQVRAAVSGGGRVFRGWMGVPEMLAALRWLDVGVRRTWNRLAWAALLEQRLEGPVLAMLEYAGPWPASESAKHRHWVAFGYSLTRRASVYDVNAGEWLDEPLWRERVPPLLRELGGDGRWSLAWAGELRVARPKPKPLRVVLVDGNNLVHRLFHARPLEHDFEGRPVNAINGWGHALRKLREQHQPDELVAVFDGPGTTWRHELLPTYKASRSPTPEALRAQWAGVVAVCERFGVPWVRRPNLEADDVLAELALAATERGHEVLLVSSDKDLMQLLRGEGGAGSIRQVLADGRVVGPEHVVEKFGVGPELLADYLALVGDRQDDVPGVKGIGAKTAVALLREFGGLEQLLAGVERVGDRKVRCRLRAGAEAARLSRRLVGLGA